ncbi:MAG TPA: lytic transglycosylase domain-containing protein [Candidatus Acidoferrum sp.]|nr:lytic transglycosylase domain-containing protein [Candidatus Acidoferrum sp.]
MTRSAQTTVPRALLEAAKAAAASHKLDAALVCAVVEQESKWDPWAIRFEPEFEKKYIQPLLEQMPPTEEMTRAMSFGLMQVMGEVARELRFTGWLTKLCDPAIGLDFGCAHLVRKIASKDGDVREGLSAYNGGGNPDYADEVMARMARYQAAK